MNASEFGVESPVGMSALDWEELSALDRVEAVYEIGDHAVVLWTTDGREIRITAWHDRARDEYVADYEKRTVVESGHREVRVWAQTPAYQRCTADDAASCLEAAVLEVDRTNVY
jgi:hypothetical protein